MAKSGGMPDGVKSVMGWALGIGIVALILLVMLILFGNLSNNVGFTASQAGYNSTQDLIGNYSSSAVNVAKQLPTVGTILGVALLLTILIGILIFAIRKMMSVSSAGGSNANFG